MICGQNLIDMKLPDQEFWEKSATSSDLDSLHYAQNVFSILGEGASVKMKAQVPLRTSLPENFPSLLFSTSGTSGIPKHCLHTFVGLEKAFDRLKIFLNAQRPLDTINCLPIHHVGGWMQVMRAWFSGGSVIFADYKDLAHPDNGGLCARRYLSLVPTQLYELLKSKHGITNLRRCKGIFIGGAHLSSELSQKARDAKLPIYVCYGMTETAGMVTILGKEDFSKGVKGVGQPMQGVLMRLDKDNRICLKCPGLVVNAKNSCAADQDWFVTSDIGKEDNGYWEIIHRMDRVINTGGEKVIPDLVEKKILEFPAVKSCLVSPINDIKWGQRVVAYITPESVNKKKLLEFLKSSLSGYQIPKELITVENLETTEEGGWKR